MYMQFTTEASNNLSGMEDILARLRLNDSRKTTPTQIDAVRAGQDNGALEKLLTTLGDPNKASKKQDKDVKNAAGSNINKVNEGSSGSDQTTDSYGMVSCVGSQASDNAKLESAEILRMKQELEAAKSVISRQEQELAESRTLKHTMDQAMGPASEIDFGGLNEISESTIGHLQSAFNATARPFTTHTGAWRSQDDNRSDQSEFSASSYPPRGIWNNQPAPGLGSVPELSATTAMMGNPRDTRLSGQQYAGIYGTQPSMGAHLGRERVFSGSSSNGLGYDARMASDLAMYSTNPGDRRNMSQYRSNSTLSDSLTPFGSFPGVAGMTSPPLSPLDAPGQYGLGQRGFGLQPAPITPSFPNGPGHGLGSPWPMTVSQPELCRCSS